MIHFKPSAFFRGRPAVDGGYTPAASPTFAAEPFGRADHARMLAHAAKRRRAAANGMVGDDIDYWKACAPAAIAKAVAIRAQTCFARLP